MDSEDGSDSYWEFLSKAKLNKKFWSQLNRDFGQNGHSLKDLELPKWLCHYGKSYSLHRVCKGWGKSAQNEVPFFDKKKFEKPFYRVEINKRARF